MKDVYIIHRGLPEYEGRSWAEWYGRAEGETLHEVVKNIIEQDNKHTDEYIEYYDNGNVYDWGFTLTFSPEEYVDRIKDEQEMKEIMERNRKMKEQIPWR